MNESGRAAALATCVVPDPELQDLGQLPQIAIREVRSSILLTFTFMFLPLCQEKPISTSARVVIRQELA